MQAKEATHPVLRCYGGMPCDMTATCLATLQQHALRHDSNMPCDITATCLATLQQHAFDSHNTPRTSSSTLPICTILFSDILGQDLFGVFSLVVVGYRWHVYRWHVNRLHAYQGPECTLLENGLKGAHLLQTFPEFWDRYFRDFF